MDTLTIVLLAAVALLVLLLLVILLRQGGSGGLEFLAVKGHKQKPVGAVDKSLIVTAELFDQLEDAFADLEQVFPGAG